MRLLLLRTGSHQLLRSITRVHSKENDVHGDIVAHVAAQWRLDAHDSFEQSSPVAAQSVLDEMHADVLILDEMTYALNYGWLDAGEVLAAIAARPAGTHVVVTGRDAPEALVAAADLVTEMRLVKHPYREQGIGAQPGIEL